MKYFLQMIEHVRRTGEIHFMDTIPNRMVNPEHFFECVEKAEILVFSPLHAEPIDLIEKFKANPYTKLDAPFPVFSFEVLGGNITQPKDLLGLENKDLAVFTDTIVLNEKEGGHNLSWVHCVLAWEVTPNQFAYYTFLTVKNTKFKWETQIVISTKCLDRVAKELVDRLNREATGTENLRQRVKLGVGKDKRTHTIRRLIHVKPKRFVTTGSDIAPSGRMVDWSHRWMVRGHWRQTASLGKDRQGNYCVEGHTWVTEHEKGPDTVPLIKKTRLITNPSAEPSVENS